MKNKKLLLGILIGLSLFGVAGMKYGAMDVWGLLKVDHNMSTGVWNHLTYIRGWGGVANRFAATVNGTAVGYTDSTFTCPDYSGVLQIGADVGHLDGYLAAQIDELRISKGIARWTANFTPPTSPYSKFK